MTAPILDFQSETYARLYAAYQAAHEATKEAWQNEVKAALALQDSKSWLGLAPTWNEYCLKYMPYTASSYRAMKVELPLSEVISAVTTAQLTTHETRQIREQFQEIVASEDRRLIPELWGICYAYDEKVVPRRDVMKAAYELLKEERDNDSISFEGMTHNVKDMARKIAIKDAVLNNIQAHSKPSLKLTLQTTGGLLQELGAILPKGAILPELGQQVTLLFAKREG